MRSLLAGLISVSVLLASTFARAEPDGATAPPAVPAAPGAAPAAAAPAAAAPAPAAGPAAPAEAAQDARKGVFQIGVRAGFGRALDGKSTRTMTTSTPSLIPLMLEAGYRTPRWFFGIFAQVALASRSDCGTSNPCSAKDYQLGVNVHYHLRPDQAWDPWVGAGLAYETLHLTGLPPRVGGRAGAVDRVGFDYAIMQMGVDFRLGKGDTGKKPRIGPFFGLSFGQMVNQSTRDDSTGTKTEIETRLDGHQWMVIGVRGTLDL